MKSDRIIPISLLLGPLLFSSCATLPPPTVEDRYIHIDAASNVGLVVVDSRKTQKIGAVGLASFDMPSVDAVLSTILRNDINQLARLNVSNLESYDNNKSKELRLPFVIQAELVSLSFVSADALLDDADGEVSVNIVIYDLKGTELMSRSFATNNQMSVSWPAMSKNSKIVKDLFNKVSSNIFKDKQVKQILSY